MQRLPFCLLLIFCAGCAKMNYQYSMVTDFYTYPTGQNWMVVTNDDGSILKIFDVPAASTQLIKQFDYESGDAPETYNLHLVHRGDTAVPSYVHSIYSVKNGASVTFNAYPYDASSPFYMNNKHSVFISGMDGLDSVVVPGVTYYFGFGSNGYNAATHTTSIITYPLSEADMIIRIRPGPDEPFRSYFLPVAGIGSDSVFLQWSDFVPDDRFLTIEPSGNGLVEELEVSAVEPGFKRFVTLVKNGYPTYQPTAAGNQVPLPAALNPQSLFRVRVRQGGFVSEKIFPPGDLLRLEAPRISVLAAIVNPYHTLQVATSGNPDLVVADFSHAYPTFYFKQWIIQGPPEAFLKMRLPDLTELLPSLRDVQLESTLWYVTAIQYDQLDYDQILAGFPQKGNDGRFFSIARSGLQMVTKSY
ncbi:MAG: hypothetical protein ABIQ93_00655 [Saprospiraceae bacterium]